MYEEFSVCEVNENLCGCFGEKKSITKEAETNILQLVKSHFLFKDSTVTAA